MHTNKLFLAVIVPVFNEERTVTSVLESVLRLRCRLQVVIVDDASTDRTIERVVEWETCARECCVATECEVIVMQHERNVGKGRAIRTGLAAVAAPIVIVQDADLEYDPADIPTVARPIQEGMADVVFGSRYLRQKSQWIRQPWVCRHGVRVLNLAVRLLYGRTLTDEATCYKAFRTDWLRRMALECERFEFCPEVTAKACRMDARIVEVPISYHPRTYAEGKKIRWRDGVEALWTLWRLRHWQPPMGDTGSATAAKVEIVQSYQPGKPVPDDASQLATVCAETPVRRGAAHVV